MFALEACAVPVQVLKQDRTAAIGGTADPDSPAKIDPKEWAARISYEGRILRIDATSYPRNPRGRTGLRGRGVLPLWGPNHMAEPIVTRYDPQRPQQLQIMGMYRSDLGSWALPTGHVEAGKLISAVVAATFTNAELVIADERVEDLFAGGELLYRGIVDDPRNTDEAWVESSVAHFHCIMQVGMMISLRQVTDANEYDLSWLDIDPSAGVAICEGHHEWVDEAARRLAATISHSKGLDRARQAAEMLRV